MGNPDCRVKGPFPQSGDLYRDPYNLNRLLRYPFPFYSGIGGNFRDLARLFVGTENIFKPFYLPECVLNCRGIILFNRYLNDCSHKDAAVSCCFRGFFKKKGDKKDKENRCCQEKIKEKSFFIHFNVSDRAGISALV